MLIECKSTEEWNDLLIRQGRLSVGLDGVGEWRENEAWETLASTSQIKNLIGRTSKGKNKRAARAARTLE